MVETCDQSASTRLLDVERASSRQSCRFWDSAEGVQIDAPRGGWTLFTAWQHVPNSDRLLYRQPGVAAHLPVVKVGHSSQGKIISTHDQSQLNLLHIDFEDSA